MDKIIYGLLVFLVGKFLYNENENIKYKRHKKENNNNNNQLISNIYHMQNQLLNTATNQTQAAINMINNTKQPIIYLSPGDHIAIDRYFPIPYSHHGIFVGDNQVIHYAYPGIIKLTSLEEFRDKSDGYIYKINSITSLSPQQIVNLAYSKLGEQNYDYITNNCETFARWCRYGY